MSQFKEKVIRESNKNARPATRVGQTKVYEMGICCFSSMHTALRNNTKDWLAGNQDIVSEWSNMSICRLLFQ